MNLCLRMTAYVIIALVLAFSVVVIGVLLRITTDMENRGTAGRQVVSAFNSQHR